MFDGRTESVGHDGMETENSNLTHYTHNYKTEMDMIARSKLKCDKVNME